MWWYENGFSDRKNYYDLCNVIKKSNTENKYVRGLKWIYE